MTGGSSRPLFMPQLPELLDLEIKPWMFRYRLKFAAGPSGLDFFISSDMFYLELVLEPTGGVKDVKVHHEGKVEQVRKPSLLLPPPHVKKE